MILEIETLNTKLRSVDNSLWKRQWTFRKTDCIMNEHGISLFIRFCEDNTFMLIYVTILLEFSIVGEKHGN